MAQDNHTESASPPAITETGTTEATATTTTETTATTETATLEDEDEGANERTRLVIMENGTSNHHTEDKINGIQLKECSSPDQSSVTSSRARGDGIGGQSSRSGSISTVKEFLNSSFNNPELEQMYQNYFAKRKRATLFFLLGIVVVYNIVLLAVSAHGYATTSKGTSPSAELIPRICVSSIVILILTILFVLYFPRLANLPSYNYLPCMLWIVVFLELIIDLLVAYIAKKHVANYSLGLYIFFIYVTYSMIRFLNLYACVIVTAVLMLFHAVAVGVINDEGKESTNLQIVCNFLLMLAALIIGVINYLVTDINQRRSFLDTRENVEFQIAQKKEERNQSRLLQSVLPTKLAEDIIKDIKKGENNPLADDACFKTLHLQTHQKCSILFADIVGFTEYSSTVTAEQLIIMLNELFANFDKLAKFNLCQRIKILGDCYYCISGLDDTQQGDSIKDGATNAARQRNDGDDMNHAENSVEMGLAVVEHIKKVREAIKVSVLDMRVGIHSGHVLAGIIGQRKWQYDVWSNDVTLANKMESGGLPGRVHVSASTYDYVKDSYSMEDGNGGDRCEYLKDNNVTTYLIKERNSKMNERWRSATVKRNSTLKKQVEQSRKAERGSRSIRDDNSPLEKISSACGRTTSRISIDNLPVLLEDGGQKAVNDFISIDTENIDDSEIKPTSNAVAHNDAEINNLLAEMLNSRNSELKDVANAATLIFKQKESEEKYREEKKQFCLLAFVTLPVCAVFAFIVEMILKKREVCNIVTFVVSFVVITFFWLLTGAGRCVQCPKSLTDISKRLHYKYVERTVVTTICVLLLLAAEIIDVCCTRSLKDVAYYNPMFYSYNGVLILLVVCTLIQLPYMARISLLLVTTVVYPLLFFLCMKELFQQYDTAAKSTSLLTTSVLLTLQYIFYFFALFFHSYQSEKTARVLMLWKKAASKGKDDVENLKKMNEKLMQNILPQHVIDHFLQVDNKDETELYSRSYGNVGVIFASIPNFFSEFYSEDSINKDGIECMRVLNEIISDFDEVLSEPRFDCIEKIKTVNSTYMAASGLKDVVDTNEEKDQWDHLVRLTDFALALKEKLNEINGESFNNFALRIGIAQGPVVAGVIGAKKPHYDIWGNTVNISSRMESTGKAGTIQVLSDTYEILKNRNFDFEKRGEVYVKGKGHLLTYILVTTKSYDYTRPQRPGKEYKENLEVNKTAT